MAKVRSLRATFCVGALAFLAAGGAQAAEIRGTLQGVTALHPTPEPDLLSRRTYFWQEPNGALDTRPARALPDFDLAIVLTGAGINESTQPVDLHVTGGRCRPGTAVVTPNTVLRVQNEGWVPQEFYATAPDNDTPLAAFPMGQSTPVI